MTIKGALKGRAGADKDTEHYEADVEQPLDHDSERFSNEEDNKKAGNTFGKIFGKKNTSDEGKNTDEPPSENMWYPRGTGPPKSNTAKSDKKLKKEIVESFFKAVEDKKLDAVEEKLAKHKELLNRKNDESSWTPLEIAANQADIEMTRFFLRQPGIDAKLQDSTGWTPLLCTAEHGYTEVAKLLLEHDAGANLPNEDGYTPLAMAAECGHVDMVKLLLASPGVDAKTTTKEGNTPLILAAKSGSPKCVKELLKHGSDVVNWANDYGETALMHACVTDIDSVKMLLKTKHNVDIGAKDKDGDAAIEWAADDGKSDSISALLDHGADPRIVNNKGGTPFMRAAKRGYEECLEVLFEKGELTDEDMLKEDKNGNTAMIHAATEGHVACVEFILEVYSREDRQRFKDDCKKALACARVKKNEDCCKKLSDHLKIDPQQLLFNAAMYGYEENLEKLLKENTSIDVNQEDKKSLRPPLYYAVKLGHEGVVRILLEKKADTRWRSRDDNATLLHHAAKGGHASIIKMLLARDGIEPKARCNESIRGAKVISKREQPKEERQSKGGGFLALDLAILEGHEGCVRMLLNRGGYHTSEGQKSPEYLAAETGNRGILSLVLDHIHINQEQTIPAEAPRKVTADQSGVHEDMTRKQRETKAFDLSRGEHIHLKTPLHAAAEQNHVACVNLLLERKMDPNTLSADNRSPLSTACEKGYDNVVELLLNVEEDHQKPNFELYDKDELHPLFLATEAGNVNCVEKLLQQGKLIKGHILDPKPKKDFDDTSPYGSFDRNARERASFLKTEEGGDKEEDPVVYWYKRQEPKSGWAIPETRGKLMQILLSADQVSWESKRTWLDSCVDGDDPKFYKAVVDILSHKTTQRRTLFLLMMDLYMYILWITSFVILAFGEIDGRYHRNLEWFATGGTLLSIVYFGVREATEFLKQHGISGYVRDIYNCVDFLAIALSCWNLGLILKGTELNLGQSNENKQYERVLISCGVFLCLSFVGYLRATFLSFAIFVGGVSKIIFDLFPFAIITLIILVVFSFIYYIQDYSVDASFSDTVLSIFFQFVGGPADDAETLADVLFAIISVIILLNVVIAIVSNSWDAAESKSFVLLCKNRLELLSQVEGFFKVLNCWKEDQKRNFDDDTFSDDYSDISADKDQDYVKKIEDLILPSSSKGFSAIGFLYKHIVYPVLHLVLAKVLPWLLGAITFGQLWPRSMRQAMFSIVPEESDTSNEEVVDVIQDFKEGFLNSEQSMMSEMKNEMKILKENNQVLHGTVQNLNTTVQKLAVKNQEEIDKNKKLHSTVQDLVATNQEILKLLKKQQ